MTGFGEALARRPVEDVVAGEPVAAGESAPALELAPVPARASENLYAAGARIAALAPRPASRRQYAHIYGRFADALRDELGRAPTTDDVTADAMAGYLARLERIGGRIHVC